MRNAWLLAVVGLYSVACATTPAPQPVPAPAIAPVTQADADELRKELEAAFASIATRAAVPAPEIPVVDVEAAASIDIPQHRTIDSALRLFTVDMKDSIQTSLIRSGRYRNVIDKALEDQDLPKGLAYLPVIESAYLPTLTSRAGAHGIWQFMPDTAREYGLRVDWWVDERADPERSTKAAAKYLKDLHRMFDDWPLALAAYNAGPGRVRRALQAQGVTTFWELLELGALPKETRGYVPTFFATILIASDPATYGFQLGEPEDLDGKRVEVEGPLSLRYLAEVAGVDADQLEAMNPALRRKILPPGRSAVRVPARAAETIASRARSLREEDAYLAVCTFKLRKGDSVKRLARAIGTKEETILAMNGIESARPGDAIYLPVRARELGTLLAHHDDREIYYAVRKGDTVTSIAKKHGLSAAELRELNELAKTAKLRPGQKLRVTQGRTMTAGGM
jgi:membrane-bound lytic murein transglycosylase D